MGSVTIFCLLLLMVATSHCDICDGIQLPEIMDQGVADGPCPANNVTTRRPTFIRYTEAGKCKLLILGCEKLEIRDAMWCQNDIRDAPIEYTTSGFAAYIPGYPTEIVKGCNTAIFYTLVGGCDDLIETASSEDIETAVGLCGSDCEDHGGIADLVGTSCHLQKLRFYNPCDNCPIPGAFTQQDYINCGREPDSGSEYAPAFIRYSLGSECYLQMMDCPGYDVATLSYCSSMARPEQALRCIAAADESACGSVGSTTQAIEMSTSYNGSKCVLTLSGCDSYNVVSGYDGTGICRTEENVVAINENGKFKLNNRYIYQVRCANPDSSQASCNGLGWKYYWATDYYFKIGFHKTYNEAKADCIAEGGQLASVHGEDENLFILLIALMSTSQHEPNFNIWLGIESDGNGGWVNVDGTPFDYNSWSSESPSGDGNCVRMSTLDVMEMPWYNVPCSADTATYACKKKGPCSFKEMLEEWRFQSCFNGGSLKLGETLEIRGKAPTVAPGDVWSINLETSSNAHALHILITEWGTDQPVIRIMSALNGFVETARYDCPYRPGVNYTFQVQNSEDQLRLIFNELDIQHPHFVSNPAEDYWAVAITIPYAIPQLYSAVITNGGIVDELGLGDTEALDEDEPVICTSCPPLTQKPTDLEGALDSILSATYDSSTGCMKASITCTATASGKYVGLFSNENLGFGNRCGTVNYTNAYTCGSNGVWLDLNEQEAMPLVECIEIPDDNC